MGNRVNKLFNYRLFILIQSLLARDAFDENQTVRSQFLFQRVLRGGKIRSEGISRAGKPSHELCRDSRGLFLKVTRDANKDSCEALFLYETVEGWGAQIRA